MGDSILFSRGCCNNITEKQLKSLRQACISDTIIDSDECKKRLNTCGMSIEELFDEYDLYDPLDETIISYSPGDRVLVNEPNGYELSLYEAIEEISTFPEVLDPSKWEKICSIKTTLPISTGDGELFSPQKTKLPQEAYELVEIGSKGHYVEKPIPYKLSAPRDTLDEITQKTPPKILSGREIEVLEGNLSSSCDLVILFDSESARISPLGAASISLVESDGDYETTDHLGQPAFAPPPGVIGESLFIHKWAIDMPEWITSGDFTIEGWVRSSTAAPLEGLGETGSVGIELRWNIDTSYDLIGMFSTVGLTDIENPGTLVLEHQAFFESQFGQGYQFRNLLFGDLVQGWKHLCYQRIDGEDVFHYHGVRYTLTQGDESLSSPRPISADAQLIVFAENQAIEGVALGQVRASAGALYGTSNFVPPSSSFFTP